MAAQRPMPDQHPVTWDIPLPGNYEVLTTQLNITRYRAGEALRYVVVTREPTNQLEILRHHLPVGPWRSTEKEALKALVQHLKATEYLMTGQNT